MTKEFLEQLKELTFKAAEHILILNETMAELHRIREELSKYEQLEYATWMMNNEKIRKAFSNSQSYMANNDPK